MNSRNIALDNIISILEDKKPLHTILLNSLKGIEDKREKAFVARLVRGCIERAYSIDRIIDGISSVKVKKQKPVIRNILRSGVYQILFMDSVTDFAACDESVKLAGRRGFRNLQGFVNGVLRNICRKKDEILKDLYIPDERIKNTVPESPKKDTGALPGTFEREKISLRYSVPGWLAERFCNGFGEEKAENAFRYFLMENGISIRVNTSRITLEDFEKTVKNIEAPDRENGIFKKADFIKNKYLDKCYNVYGLGSIEDIEAFKKGLFTVQDMSSALVGYVCESIFKNKAEKEIGLVKALDLCAAPGGKSMYLADLGMEVTSCDISEQKLELISENIERCGFDNIILKINDATVFNPEFEGSYDIVLCDLPCSGLGIVGKKPDIKYNVTEEKIDELAGLQKRILKNAVKYVKNGGYLLYSTCTVTDEENAGNVRYLNEELKLRGIPLKELLPKGIMTDSTEDCFIQLLPGEYGSDGFFVSLFKN